MNDYYLELMGIRVLLRTPGEISVAENLRPFLTQPQKMIDCTIALQPCEILPTPSEDGQWFGMDYYDYCQGVSRVFYCHKQGADAFAVSQIFENGDIQIAIAPDYLSFFEGSEGIFNRIGLETLLLRKRGLLLHASLIKYAGQAIAFAGPSGVGKSTQAALWQTCFGAELLNGDRTAIRKEPGGFVAYGSPYAGTSGIYKNDHAPLAAIVVLQQGKENQLTRLTPTEAFRHIFPEITIHRWDKAFTAQVTDLCLEMLDAVPVYLLCCCPEESTALFTKRGLGL